MARNKINVSDTSENLEIVAHDNVQTQDVFAINADALVVSADFMRYSIEASDVIDKRLNNVLSVMPAFFTRSIAPKASKNAHQVPNCYRAEGNNPLMPDLALFLRTGNPYPSDIETVSKVPVSSENYSHYRDNIYVANILFAMLVSDNSEAGISTVAAYHSSGMIADASGLKGKPISKKEATNGNHIYYGVLDTLRDLEQFGFVYATNGKNGTRRADTSFKLNAEYRALALALLTKSNN